MYSNFYSTSQSRSSSWLTSKLLFSSIYIDINIRNHFINIIIKKLYICIVYFRTRKIQMLTITSDSVATIIIHITFFWHMYNSYIRVILNCATTKLNFYSDVSSYSLIIHLILKELFRHFVKLALSLTKVNFGFTDRVYRIKQFFFIILRKIECCSYLRSLWILFFLLPVPAPCSSDKNRFTYTLYLYLTYINIDSSWEL